LPFGEFIVALRHNVRRWGNGAILMGELKINFDMVLYLMYEGKKIVNRSS
jgi:hypothetical protein